MRQHTQFRPRTLPISTTLNDTLLCMYKTLESRTMCVHFFFLLFSNRTPFCQYRRNKVKLVSNVLCTAVYVRLYAYTWVPTYAQSEIFHQYDRRQGESDDDAVLKQVESWEHVPIASCRSRVFSRNFKTCTMIRCRLLNDCIMFVKRNATNVIELCTRLSNRRTQLTIIMMLLNILYPFNEFVYVIFT